VLAPDEAFGDDEVSPLIGRFALIDVLNCVHVNALAGAHAQTSRQGTSNLPP